MTRCETRKNSCPVCGGSVFRKLFEIERPDLGEDVSYAIRKCHECAYVYADGPTTEDILLKAYGGSFHASSQQYAPIDKDGNFSPHSRKFPVVINAIQRVRLLQKLGLRGRLLDIGAGRGYFVKAASKIFEAEGIELAPDAAAFGATMGTKISIGNFLTHEFDGRNFDVITFWDVFSGLPDPCRSLSKVQSLLRHGGTLIMTVPDAGSIVARMLGRFWPLMIPPVNLGFYTRSSLVRLLTAHDFTPVSITHSAKWVSLDFLLRKFARSFLKKDVRLTKLPIPPSLRISVNLHDILTVIAVRC